jgi:hypothetical protein
MQNRRRYRSPFRRILRWQFHDYPASSIISEESEGLQNMRWPFALRLRYISSKIHRMTRSFWPGGSDLPHSIEFTDRWFQRKYAISWQATDPVSQWGEKDNLIRWISKGSWQDLDRSHASASPDPIVFRDFLSVISVRKLQTVAKSPHNFSMKNDARQSEISLKK